MTHYLSQCDLTAGCGKTYPADLTNCPHCGAMSALSLPAPLDPRDWGYDLETYPNIFTATFTHAHTGMTFVYEISDRKNDHHALCDFVYGLGKTGARGVGFNNVNFDYPVLHWVVNAVDPTVQAIYAYAQQVITSRNGGGFGITVWDRDMIFPQIDLFKIHHFDNKAKSTSLKALEIVMRSQTVEDLPYPVGTMLDDSMKDVLISYNKKDVRETLKFYVRSLPEIHLREKLSERYKRNMMNFSNTKIGSTILTMKMEEAGIVCFDGKVPRQTIRTQVAFKDVIFPFIKFEHPEFNKILQLFQSKTIKQSEINDDKLTTKGVFKDLNCTINGFTFVFGVGGIHGSIESQIVYSDDEFQIVDVDVTSFYPRTAIVNNMYPEHLGQQYCITYNEIFEERATYPKGTPENAALKESLNASYGNSNNAFSPLFDPAYTMKTTINGQLMLCMLAEQLIKIPQLTMIQANTDGLTVRCPRVYLDHMRNVCKWWETVTGLQLEEALYKRMIIRDVNNYIAEYDSGKLKRKGAYEYKMNWHQDPSALIVPKAAEAALVHGKDIREFITSHRDPFDFMLRAKVPRNSTLIMQWKEWGAEQQLQHITRYFIARSGGTLVKRSPPTGEPGTWKRKNGVSDEMFHAVMRELSSCLDESCVDSAGTPWDARIHTGNKSRHDQRELGISVGWKVMECANADDFDWSQLNYDYYIQEAEKLVKPLLK